MVKQATVLNSTIGWIGTGRMGFAMASRLLAAGADLTVYNRTKSKAQPLEALGAKIVDMPAELADRDIVFTMVSGPEAFLEVTLGKQGLLSAEGVSSKQIIDCTTLSTDTSKTVRAAAANKGVAMLDAPVSGNAAVVEAGKLSIVTSGERAAFDHVLPVLECLAEGVTYAGEGECARTVKICHNVLLAIMTQALAEILVLGEQGGVKRHAMMDFINKSVMGSRFSGYKTPAFVNLDFTPTFTPVLLRKDLDLALDVASELDVPLPVTSQVRDLVQSLISEGYVDCDFAALLELQAKAAGLVLQSEDMDVGTNL